ncbi:TonB-dependent receptor [Pontixanthobacter aestiaquae]|uniref:TonB-dependent receptor n=1 Tax=Pontixanthobacter aestiaquae TaxID=1509367 RepID=A0A844ZB00_9SPHN|nr:TonB-dependent receptor [Pontixanthobacter aestiaquae]MDN3644796.1 TonB-dependent receptor [Pontixanthobacter aestiaquae]MXO84197.1 TonB-dependent receptor [Pontixanthobacter aestiaquae]
MKKFQESALKGLACSVSAMAMILSAPVMAQDTDPEPAEEEEEQVDVTETGEAGGEEDGAIVVTGSRIKRDTYSSISPLQVITTEQSREVGLFDASQILQRDESAAGQQIDATFAGFVVDNGPGSATLNLRGLGADRTLLLVNGRRLAPAGVEGAPSNPSINLLPSSLIDRFDLLLDGASSIYGSDAVAGVGNIILRKDFDGLELFARGEINPQGAGEDYSISGAYGINLDRGFIGIGVEYDHRDAIRFNDRRFFQGCASDYEVDQDGNILTVDKRTNAIVQSDSNGAISTLDSPCRITGFTSDFQGRFVVNDTFLNSVFAVRNGDFDNLTQFGLPGFGTRENQVLDPLDLDGDGLQDVNSANYLGAGQNQEQVFLSEQNLINVMAYGEYTLPGEANITPYFEVNYSRAEITNDNFGVLRIDPRVPADNAFNPCNVQTGVDCRVVTNGLFQATTGRPPIYGPGGLFPPLPQFDIGQSVTVQPFVAVAGDRNNVEITQEQYRGVLGVRGDLPFISPSWSFDASFVYSRSVGKTVRNGLREDKLAFSLGIDPTADFNNDGIFDNTGDGIADDYDPDVQFGNNAIYNNPGITPCDANALANPGAAMPDLLDGCVPVNLFAPSLLNSLVGEFASQAERDYLIGQRGFDTIYEQKVLSAFMTGNLFDLQGGPVGLVLGAEYRTDSIESEPDAAFSNGLFLNFNADQGAAGEKYILEGFGELDLPLVSGKDWVEELSLNLSGRVTKEEFYGTNFTYSIKGGWRPIEPLLMKLSYGTSFRAPNLRENFLRQQTSFNTVFDPCAVPAVAIDTLGGTGYNPANDPRSQAIFDNCRREGRDPLQVGLIANVAGSQQTNSAQIVSGGSFDIDPETSRSLTAGFAFEETFGDGYDVSVNFNYYDIKLKDSIVEANPGFIIFDCFAREDGNRSAFCDRLSFQPLNGATGANPRDAGLVSRIENNFLNFDTESVRGIDINTFFGKEVTMFGTLVDLGLNVRANHLIERSTTFVDDNGNVTFDEDAGEFGLPKWTGRAVFTADIDKFRLTWQVRYTGPVEQDIDGIDAFADAFQNGPDGGFPVAPNGDVTPNQFGNTCTGGGDGGAVAGDGVFCRDVGFASEQFLHTASVRYRDGDWTLIAGVDNIFNTAPPLVDPTEVTSVANTAIGLGYDYDGREFFFSVRKEF